MPAIRYAAIAPSTVSWSTARRDPTSRMTANGATRYSSALTAKAMPRVCEVPTNTTSTTARTATTTNATAAMTRTGRGAFAVRRVNHTVAI